MLISLSADAEASRVKRPPYADIVVDAGTGRILHSSSSNALRHPASLTKMMTLYLTFQALEAKKLSLGSKLYVSAQAAKQPPSKLGLKRGQKIRVSDAIMALITASANDVAVVLAEELGKTESQFARLMTKQARALGMKRTVFKNASGLPNKGQVTTARDMAILGYALLAHYPRYYAWFKRQHFIYDGLKRKNHNNLMKKYPGMDGIKTGYINASGFNLVASAKRGETRIITVVMGGRTSKRRDERVAYLMDQAFVKMKKTNTSVMGERLEKIGHKGVVVDRDYMEAPATATTGFDSKQRGFFKAMPVQSMAEIPEHKPVFYGGRWYSPDAPFLKEKVPTQQNILENGVPTNWGIQVGAFSEERAARIALGRMAENMPKLVGEADHVLQKISEPNGSFVYRARFMGLEQQTARSICSYMIRRQQSCLVVVPQQKAD